MLTYEHYPKLIVINRLANGRGLGSIYCILGLPRGRTHTESNRSRQPRLQTQTLARYAAVLCGPTCVHLCQYTRGYETPLDRSFLTCCIYSQLFRNYRPSGVPSTPRECARRFRNFCQWRRLEYSKPVFFCWALWQRLCVPW